MSIKLIYDNLD